MPSLQIGTFDFRSIRPQTFDVIGVAKDVNEDFVAKKLKPSVYFPLRPADYAQPSDRNIRFSQHPPANIRRDRSGEGCERGFRGEEAEALRLLPVAPGRLCPAF